MDSGARDGLFDEALVARVRDLVALGPRRAAPSPAASAPRWRARGVEALRSGTARRLTACRVHDHDKYCSFTWRARPRVSIPPTRLTESGGFERWLTTMHRRSPSRSSGRWAGATGST